MSILGSKRVRTYVNHPVTTWVCRPVACFVTAMWLTILNRVDRDQWMFRPFVDDFMFPGRMHVRERWACILVLGALRVFWQPRIFQLMQAIMCRQHALTVRASVLQACCVYETQMCWQPLFSTQFSWIRRFGFITRLPAQLLRQFNVLARTLPWYIFSSVQYRAYIKRVVGGPIMKTWSFMSADFCVSGVRKGSNGGWNKDWSCRPLAPARSNVQMNNGQIVMTIIFVVYGGSRSTGSDLLYKVCWRYFFDQCACRSAG